MKEWLNIGKKIDEKEFRSRLKANNPTIEYVDGYSVLRKPAIFKCSICGNVFEREAKNVCNGSTSCSICLKNKRIDDLNKKLKENNPSIEYIEGYTDPHKLATFRCKKCGHVWKTTAYEVYTGKAHCRNCNPSPYLFTEDKIRERLKENNPDIEYVSDYTGSLNKATFKCRKCNHTWSTIAFPIYLGKNGCPKCSFSKGESKIAKYLDNKDIDYESGYVFDDCKNIYGLPFDFYISSKNLCIEYDGEQHFKPIIRSKNMTYIDALENFKKIQKRDSIKNEYCKNNSIYILRIPYTQFKNIENILDTYFENIKIN